jgi:hypothetical protein
VRVARKLPATNSAYPCCPVRDGFPQVLATAATNSGRRHQNQRHRWPASLLKWPARRHPAHPAARSSVRGGTPRGPSARILRRFRSESESVDYVKSDPVSTRGSTNSQPLRTNICRYCSASAPFLCGGVQKIEWRNARRGNVLRARGTHRSGCRALVQLSRRTAVPNLERHDDAVARLVFYPQVIS